MIWSIASSVARRLGLSAMRRFIQGAGSSILRGVLRNAGRSAASQQRLYRILNILDKVMRKTERTAVMSHILRNTYAGDLLELVLDVLWAIAQDAPDEAVADVSLRDLLKDEALQMLTSTGVIRTDCLTVAAIENHLKSITDLIKRLEKAILIDEDAIKVSAARAFYHPNFFQGNSPAVDVLSQIIMQAALEAGFTDFQGDQDRLANLVASSTKALVAREYFPVLFNVAMLLGLTTMAGQLACALATKQAQVAGIIGLPCLKDQAVIPRPSRDIPTFQNSLAAGVVRVLSKKQWQDD
jgi:hypothetical protein